MVERSLSMRQVVGSMPTISTYFFVLSHVRWWETWHEFLYPFSVVDRICFMCATKLISLLYNSVLLLQYSGKYPW